MTNGYKFEVTEAAIFSIEILLQSNRLLLFGQYFRTYLKICLIPWYIVLQAEDSISRRTYVESRQVYELCLL